jgi:hypothetical protein
MKKKIFTVVSLCLCGCDCSFVDHTSGVDSVAAGAKTMRERERDGEPCKVIAVFEGALVDTWDMHDLAHTLTGV